MATLTQMNADGFCSKSNSINVRQSKIPSNKRRHTPYATPLPNLRDRNSPSFTHKASKRRRQRLQGEEEAEVLKHDTVASKVVSKTWRVYRISPLYSFQADLKTLKLYERHLNRFLSFDTCSAREMESTAKRKVIISRLQGDKDGDFGVEIKISNSRHKNAFTKEELVAIFFCAGGNLHDMENIDVLNENFTSLPICLIKSNVLLKETFLNWLEEQFGCRASPFLFSPTDLAWLVTLCAGIGEPTKSVDLTYTVPAFITELNTILVKMDGSDARKIWNLIHNHNQKYFTSEEATKMLKAIETHFYHHFKIHLNQMHLTTVASSVACVRQEGRLKVLQEECVCYILQQLVQLTNFT